MTGGKAAARGEIVTGYKSIVLALALLATAAALEAQTANQGLSVVLEVKVRGNTRMSINAVLAHVKTRPGYTYDEGTVRADEQHLLDTGKFSTVNAEKTQTDEGIILTFVVVERPAIKTLKFLGNKAINEADLIKELGYGTGGPLSRYNAESGRQALLNKYRAEGYFFADVSVDWPSFENQELIFRIVEGPQVKIRKITIEGNDYFSTIKIKWEVGSSARFWPIIKGYLDLDQVERDINTIRNLYVAEGFLDVEVDRRLEFSDDKKDARLTFVIRENDRYRVNQVIFEGNKIFSSEELAKRVKLAQGEFYTALSLRRDVKKLEDTYGELGYIESKVDSKKRFLDPQAPVPQWATKLGPKPALLDLVFTIKESDQFRVGQVIIRGNGITQSRVIRRELRFYPEQLYDTVAVEEAKKILTESRLFEEVTITPTGKEPGVRDALVQVKEGKTADFMVGIGVSSRDGLLGNITFAQRNFDIGAWPTNKTDMTHGEAWKGAGQTLRVTLEPGLQVNRFSIDWTEPYLMDQPYSLGVRGFVFNRERETYNETRFGPVVSLGHTFKNRWYAEVAARVEGVDIDQLTDSAPPEVHDCEGMNLIMGLKGTIARNRTDSRWLPSEGDSIRVSYEQVTGDWNFGEVNADYHIYKTLYTDALDRKHILSGRTSFGEIFGDAPVFETFYGGGQGSIRGFKYRGISPRSAGTDQQIGGNFMFFAGTEYTFPLVTEFVRGVVFVDSGTVERDVGITSYRISTGFGVRWVIPFFGPMPMSLDFGFPIAKDSQDDTQLVSFSFGWTF